jgi:E3 ubiquitin-protein ligase RAD18
MESTDISDPTDWIGTSLASLAAVDASVRCQVCKEFFTNPVITTCLHTFCSLCIRRCLVTDGKCPTCKTTIQEPGLRRNVAIEEVTDAFVAARPAALGLAKAQAEQKQAEEQQTRHTRRGSKRKRSIVTDEDETPATSQTQPRRSQRHRSNHTTQPPPPDVFVIDDDDQDGSYAPEPKQPEDGLVACPICTQRMKEEAVFPHLNVCDGTAPPPSPRKPSRTPTPLLQHQQHRQAVAAQDPPPDRLPSLNYSILKENPLRKKLADLGIPNSGPRKLLERRHTEWRNLWNANCDSSRPRTRRELLKDLDRWERTQGAGSKDNNSKVMEKDFDGSGWAKSHKSDFDELIANARRKRELPVTTAPKGEATQEAGDHGGMQTNAASNSTSHQQQTPLPTIEDAMMPQPAQQPAAPYHQETVNRPISPVPGFNPRSTVGAISGSEPSLDSGFHADSDTLHILPTSTIDARAPSSTPQTPPAPHHTEHVNKAVPPVPGFNLSTSLHSDTPDAVFNNTPSLPSDRTNTDTNTEVSTTLESYVNGEQGKQKTWKPEGKIRKKPMFDLPGDPVVDSEMSGTK